MANIIRKPEESPTPYAWDPFQIMRQILHWDPLRELPGTTHAHITAFTPQFEVKETKDAFIFRGDLPGVDDKDLEINLTGNRLTISGKREAEKQDEGDNYFTYERSYGNFTRSFTLPEGVDAEQINAELKGGVLEVRIAKKPEHQPKRINVRSVGERVKGLFEKDKSPKA
jgi:HSP20 family protein